MGRKYNKYKIIVSYTNGDKEEVKLNGINNSSYKETMKLYKDVKDEYINLSSVSTISFLGQTLKGELEAMFTKEVNIKQEQTTEDFIEENINKDVRDTVTEISDRIQLLKTQKESFYSKVMICEKRRDTLLHMVGMLGNKRFTSKENEIQYKIKMLDDIKRNEIERRLAKDNLGDIDKIFTHIESVQSKIKPFCKIRGKFTMKPETFEKQVEKTIRYKTDKERIRYMSQFQSKYDKVVNDPIKKELFFYNNVGEGKKKNKKAI